MAINAQALRLFSADDHIIEHADVWQDRVSAKHREDAPKVIEEDGQQFWLYEGVRGVTMGLNAVAGKAIEEFNNEPVRFTDMIEGCYDPAKRAKDLMSDGIYASVLFPSLPRFSGTLFLTFKNKALALECVKAYNDFVLDEWCAAGPPGLYVPTVIAPLWSVDLAAAEIHRCADKGARALSFPENSVPLGLPSYWDSSWNPVWQACADRDIVLCLHIGTSGETMKPSPEAPDLLRYSLLQIGSISASVNLMLSPVCRLYPTLKFVFSEGGIGWVPNALERADRMWDRHRIHANIEGQKPSDIFRQNMYLCMIEEPICLRYRDDIGVDRILWECDYPHADTVWPNSRESAASVFAAADLSESEVRMISHENAERVFNWKMAVDPW